MKSNCKQFNKSIQGASARAYYIDRIDIRVNDLSIRTRVQRELKTADKRGMIHKFKISHIRYGESFDVGFPKQTQIRGFKLQLSRPSKNLMNRLGAILVNSHYTISWIEIAYDINTESDDDAMELIQVLAGMIVIPRISRSPTFQDQDGKITKCPIGPIVSVYFSYENIESKREHKQAKEKRATKNKMFKIYIPKEGDKLYGSTSVHTEFCLKGADMIESFGILTIGDVVTFDLSSFFMNLHRGVRCKSPSRSTTKTRTDPFCLLRTNRLTCTPISSSSHWSTKRSGLVPGSSAKVSSTTWLR